MERERRSARDWTGHWPRATEVRACWTGRAGRVRGSWCARAAWGSCTSTRRACAGIPCPSCDTRARLACSGCLNNTSRHGSFFRGWFLSEQRSISSRSQAKRPQENQRNVLARYQATYILYRTVRSQLHPQMNSKVSCVNYHYLHAWILRQF